MKKIFPVITIVLFCSILYITSCTKPVNHASDNSSYYCLCGYPSVKTGADSIVTSLSIGGVFSPDKAAVQCAQYQTTIQTQYPGAGCAIE